MSDVRSRRGLEKKIARFDHISLFFEHADAINVHYASSAAATMLLFLLDHEG
jgi:hypothetical protein